MKLVIMGDDGNFIRGEQHVKLKKVNADGKSEVEPDDAVLRQYTTRAAMSDNADGVSVSRKCHDLWGFHQPANLIPLAESKR
jgi:hypothetical protein